MLSRRYESQARQLQREIKDLEARHRAAVKAEDSAKFDLAKARPGSRLRDRCLILVWCGGDRGVYEKIRELRQRHKSRRSESEQGRRATAAAQESLKKHVREGLASSDSAYQKSMRKMEEAKEGKQSCAKMQELVLIAIKQVKKARSSPAARTLRDASVAIEVVRAQVADLKQKAGPDSVRQVNNLTSEFSSSGVGSSRVRNKELRAALDVLGRYESNVKGRRRSFESKEKSAEKDLRQRLENELKRFS